MRYLALALILFCSIPALAQEKPLTQAEYVKMLYALQKAPDTRIAIIDALRKRGIDFAVDDGVRGLTRSKAGNDDELRRALEEAGRRKENPTASKLPSAQEAKTVLELTRKNTLAAVDDMPDFVVKQQIQRYDGYAGTGNFQIRDRLVVGVSYRASGEEDYRVLSKDGVIQTDTKAKSSYEDTGGTSSTGEFVTVLATIFKPESETKFELLDTDLIRGRRALIFGFTTSVEKAQERISNLSESTMAGMKGRVWVDRDSDRVLRIESDATDIPANFPIPAARRTIDYDFAVIGDEKYLLPSLSDVRLTIRDHGKLYETKNVIRFKDYQKYGTEVIIRDDDNSEPEPTKPSN